MITFLKKIGNAVLFYRARRNSTSYITYLQGRGIKIGEGSIIYSPTTTSIDVTRPHLVEIGRNVRITGGVVILTHGADWHVLRNVYRDPFVCGSAGKVVIGDNVFLGMNSIILKGTTIGENSIIGAGSVVARSIPAQSVAAGNPARVLMDLETYYRKRQKAIIAEAKEDALEYWQRNNRVPPAAIFREFFFLFVKRDEKGFADLPVRYQMGPIFEDFLKTSPLYDSFEDFLIASGIPKSAISLEDRRNT